jgi:hypothetical protein
LGDTTGLRRLPSTRIKVKKGKCLCGRYSA